MTRRSNAPDWVLTLRIVGSLFVTGAYVVFRLPLLTSTWEAALTWVGAIVCGCLTLSSLEELGLRKAFRQQPIEPVWPDEVELAIAAARHAAMMPIVDRGVVVEPKLFTHEFQPLTPPHGISLSHAADAILYATTEYVGRHRLPEAQLGRERTGQFFGTL